MKPATILVVEDDDLIRKSIVMLLEMEQYKVLQAANGREALEIITKQTQPCLILLDLMMPEMPGWEFLKEKSRMHTIATIPVVVITASTDMVKDLIPDHDVPIVKKPIDLDILITFVKKFC